MENDVFIKVIKSLNLIKNIKIKLNNITRKSL